MEIETNKPDIKTNEDLTKLVTTFYEVAKVDPLIGTFFTEVVQVNWEKHIPLIVSFWDSSLFGTTGYTGNMIEGHKHIHEIKKMEVQHFDRWFLLWEKNIRKHFEGPKAEEAIDRGRNIAQVLQYKLNS